MSRRKAPSYIEIRCPDGFKLELENPPEELIRQLLQVIGSHGRPDAAKRAPRRFTRASDDPMAPDDAQPFRDASAIVRGQDPVQ